MLQIPRLTKVNRQAQIEAVESDAIADDDEPYKLPDPQLGAQEVFYDTPADVCIYGGAAGSGKAHPCYSIEWAFNNINAFTVDSYCDMMHLIPEDVKSMDSKILMWNGEWKSLSEIAVGDRVMNPDGEFQEILLVHERGLQDIYRITFEDKTFVECAADHLWGFWEARTDSRRKTRDGYKPIMENNDASNWNINYITRARVRNTRWMFSEVQKGRRFFIPISAPLNYTNLHRGNSDRAWLYGALIGDGMIARGRDGGISLTTIDEWIKERCFSLVENYKILEKQNTDAVSISIKDDWVRHWAVNSGLLGKKSHDKFLPQGYLKESLEFRWNLAQGLFDTDGYASMSAKNEVSYCTVSPQLAEDVANLVRSLGFIAKIRQKQGVCYSKGYEGEKRMSYIISVEGNGRWRLFSLPRKIEAAREHEPNIWVGKAIVSIEKLDRQIYCRCITVSNPNSLYVTDGYNVTHNSFALLLKAAKYIEVPGYGSVILRRTSPEITNEGGLWDESRNLYKNVPGAEDREYKLDWLFSAGSAVSFGHAQYEKDVENKYPGAQICHIGFDELTKFTERQFWFLFSRNRSTCGVVPRIDATCNPDADSWVAKLIEWYINQDTGYPIEERSGVLRYFYRINGEIHWGDSAEELEEKFPDLAAIAPPKSFTFIAATVYDNPALLKANPQYLSNLLSLHPVEMERLLKGNWKIKYEAGIIFDRKWFEIVNSVPHSPRSQVVRFWDFAATSQEVATASSYYTASQKWTVVDDVFYILDCYWEQVGAVNADESLLSIAKQDSNNCMVRWELEGGSAGLRYEAVLKRMLSGYNAAGVKPLGDKVTRALTWAKVAKQGRIKLLRGAWNDQFLSAVHQFDGTKKPLINDIVDSGGGAHDVLSSNENKPRYQPASGTKLINPFA